MTPLKFYLGLAVAIFLAVGASIFYGHYTSLTTDAAVGEQRGTVLDNTSKTVDDGEAAAAAAAQVAAAVASAADAFKYNQQKAQTNEPETANRAGRAVPVSVRNNYAERRRARERSGCVRVECETGSQAGPAAER